ncbi:MAG: YaiI/YqxD family protein [Bacillota bacterium]|nr:YaiI/YqxD family protein [Clostridia bacterium]
MKILVDADACPVKDIIISLGKKANIPVEMVASLNHRINEESGVTVIIADTGPDAADLVIANRVKAGDIVVTQDYGLAALVLGKQGMALSPRGLIFSKENINGLLFQRYISSKVRRGGGKIKGPAPFTEEDRDKFTKSLQKLLKSFIILS